MNNNNNNTETNDNNNNNNNNNNINNDSTNEQPEKEMISAEDLEKLLIETMNSKPKANVGKISKVENVADIPVVPFKKRFVPTRAPKTVIGQYQEPLMARPSSDIKGYKKKKDFLIFIAVLTSRFYNLLHLVQGFRQMY